MKERRILTVSDLPENYFQFISGLGSGKPRHLIIAPLGTGNEINLAIELGFMQTIDASVSELLDNIGQLLSSALVAAKYRAYLQELVEETQAQAEELQSQSEELKVSNEELEEQGRALKETQKRLEQQQTHLEESNIQLEEQTQALDKQNEALSKSRVELEYKAKELEQSSKYKSDFLANMSHELRTPLNSSLILAKLLADNPDGNLSADQVKYAQTIISSGNDLLLLINDILDLSKIEAGHMDITSEVFNITRLIESMNNTFAPIAQQKSLTFETVLSATCPPSIESDRVRLEQILKNLISNALKFTEKGVVTLAISFAEDRFRFDVSDTGIGISPSQQKIIFEAFRQADGTTNRRYGGTGLGLSIARELTKLLGGTIEVMSEIGKGSTFSVFLPESTFQEPRIVQSQEPIKTEEPKQLEKKKRSDLRRRFVDDRDKLTGDLTTILIVEDDEDFASVVCSLARESKFQCLIATTAEEGVAMAIQFNPSAVILDVGLPDNSGLSVLDRLKQDSRTRHIPVHIISGHDYTQTAFSLGAAGYMLKPIKKEELSNALRELEQKISKRMRRILIVEDNDIQRESLMTLLKTQDVETVGVATMAETLVCLKDATFDCMVLDLSLPDATGYQLLETLSAKDTYSFPPVIVYTGHELSAEEEEQLRKYSKSIIIKGAKSPERLLDEVSLFLHQVVNELPEVHQRMIEKARNRDAAIEGRQVLIVEDDVRNIFALTSVLEGRGAMVKIARNGKEALQLLEASKGNSELQIDLVLMDIMMPEMDGYTAMREIRKDSTWKKLPIIALTAKAMKDDQEQCLAAGANDYMSKPLDIDKLLSLIRVWIPR